MIARNGPSYFERAKGDNPAAAPEDYLRKGEFDGYASGVGSPGQIQSSNVVDFAAAVDAEIGQFVVNSDTITWATSMVDGKRRGAVKLKPGGLLLSDPAGVFVDPSGVAPFVHTHDQLHNPATVKPGLLSVVASFGGASGQELNAEVAVDPAGGLRINPSGVACDFGTGANQPARGNHTHAQLHNPASVVSTSSLTLFIQDQMISGVARYEAAPTAAGRGQILIGASGAYVDLGPGANQAAAGNHTHPNASAAAPGFESIEHFNAIENLSSLADIDQNVSFNRDDTLLVGKYVGGRNKWQQTMQLLWAAVDAWAPSGQCLLGIEIGGTVLDYLSIPGGAAGSDVTNLKAFSNLGLSAGAWLRIVSVSGVGVPEQEPANVNVTVGLRPSIASILPVRINAGGGAVTPFGADAFYSAGAAGSYSGGIVLAGVTDPAPESVYKTFRYKFSDQAPLNYTITGLLRGISYKVRLHWAENYFSNISDNRMSIRVTGATVLTTAAHDTLAQTGGLPHVAYIREYTLQADSSGHIQVQITPLQGNGGNYNLSLNALELIPM